MPNGQYFGGAPNAFAGGMEFNAYRRDSRKRENALNALIERFGPEAASPAALAQLQAVEQQGQLFPHVLSAQERATRGQETVVDRYGPVAGDPTAQAAEGQERQRLRAASMGAAQMLKMARDNGADMGEAFERMSGVMTALGHRPDELESMREMIVQDPAFVDQLAAYLQGEQQGSAVGGIRAISGGVDMVGEDGEIRRMIPMSDGTFREVPGTPVQPLLSQERNAQGWERLSDVDIARDYPGAQPGVQYWKMPDGRVVADVVPGSPQEQERQADMGEAASEARTAINVATGVLEQNLTVVRHGQRAMEIASRLSRSGVLSANVRLAQSKIPGTEMFELDRDIQSVKDNIGINELLRIKASGSGLGQVPQQQLITLQSVLGRLEIQRDPENLRQDLANVIRIFGEIAERSQGEIDASREALQSQGVSRGTSFGPQPRPTPITGLSVQDRALQLMAEGLSDQGIIDRLKAEGLIK